LVVSHAVCVPAGGSAVSGSFIGTVEQADSPHAAITINSFRLNMFRFPFLASPPRYSIAPCRTKRGRSGGTQSN
jgi:hypothetical protein